jgi:O-antigen ligase
MLSLSHNLSRYSLSLASWISFFLAASLFSIPLSSSLKSIFIAVSLILIICSPTYRQDLVTVLRKPWCVATLLLFVVSVIAVLWSPATPKEQWAGISKYSKLLYLPILVAGFRDPKAQRWGLYGFLMAMSVTFVVSLMASWEWIPLPDNKEVGGMFRNHIMTGYMMAFAAYLSVFLFLKNHGKARFLYVVLTIVFSYHVWFINNGRTGYVVYVLLMGLLMVQFFSWRHAVLGTLFSSVLLIVSYHYSPVMQTAIRAAISDCQRYTNNEKDTSIGYRLQFHHYAHDLFKRHPIIGNGTAGFMHLFHDENPIPTWGERLLEPHSQYWLVASEFGVLGLLSLASFFSVLLLSSWRLQQSRPIALAVLLPFIAGNVSDSLLFYSGTGYFFIMFMALCLSERTEDSKTYVV